MTRSCRGAARVGARLRKRMRWSLPQNARVIHGFFLGPRGIRLLHLSRYLAVPLNITHEDDIGDEPPVISSTEEETDAISLNLKPLSYVAPDESKLIIEEVGMGWAKGQKAQQGSKVTVKYQFKSDGGGDSRSVESDLVLGSSEVLGGLHEGIIGMRIRDTRKITIPPSLRHGGEPICEVTLVRVHKDL